MAGRARVRKSVAVTVERSKGGELEVDVDENRKGKERLVTVCLLGRIASVVLKWFGHVESIKDE